jgi:hypothetical protein
LPFSERPHLLAKYDKDSNSPIVPDQGDVQDASDAAFFDPGYRNPNVVAVRIRLGKVLKMKKAPALDHAGDYRYLIEPPQRI